MYLDPVGVVAIAALETLVQVSPAVSQGYLYQALENADSDVIKTAVSLLLKANHKEQLLSHSKSFVRLEAVAELQLQDRFEWQLLFEQQLVVENDPNVRRALEEALRRGTIGV